MKMTRDHVEPDQLARRETGSALSCCHQTGEGNAPSDRIEQRWMYRMQSSGLREKNRLVKV